MSKITDKSALGLNPKQRATVELLKNTQLSIPQVAKVVGYSRSYAYEMQRKAKDLYLKSPEMQRKAYKAIEETLDMKPQKTTEKTKNGFEVKDAYPTHSNRLEAARMVVDRTEPAVKQVRQVSASYVQVDLSKFEGAK